ncbi:MAG TPA: PEP-CTERM sorting domain-containing protein, partial [Candidatus Solibacter sp.]|nr:PEP-CTERM sorting domain-containing protein [Candidatus Solibacter sp.]
MAFGATAANVFVDERGEGFPIVSGVPICNGDTIVFDCITQPQPFAAESIFFTFVSSVPTAPGEGGTFYSRLLEGPWETETTPGSVSDIMFFTLTVGSPNIDIRACSDPDTDSLSCAIQEGMIEVNQPAVGSPKIENGDFQLMASYVFVGGPNQGQIIDNFFMASDAPEPASLLIFGSGLIAVGMVARRRRKA